MAVNSHQSLKLVDSQPDKYQIRPKSAELFIHVYLLLSSAFLAANPLNEYKRNLERESQLGCSTVKGEANFENQARRSERTGELIPDQHVDTPGCLITVNPLAIRPFPSLKQIHKSDSCALYLHPGSSLYDLKCYCLSCCEPQLKTSQRISHKSTVDDRFDLLKSEPDSDMVSGLESGSRFQNSSLIPANKCLEELLGPDINLKVGL
ncbi:hypothetical protein VNO77_03446 [Canavalia gladiata]|uniref:Uncharacterized protein n=1 Tax=Canavalia gladiata TaxID=3824 RepID=A0AAN9N0E0_CANGL